MTTTLSPLRIQPSPSLFFLSSSPLALAHIARARRGESNCIIACAAGARPSNDSQQHLRKDRTHAIHPSFLFIFPFWHGLYARARPLRAPKSYSVSTIAHSVHARLEKLSFESSRSCEKIIERRFEQ